MKHVFFFLFFSIIFSALSYAQNDTTIIKTDTQTTLNTNKFLNSKSAPVSLAIKLKTRNNEEPIFYLLLALFTLLACLKFFYDRYFTNLFRVFFNTSIRQNQLTDQLLQAKLPSLLFNLFFIISGGMYVYFILVHQQWITAQNKWVFISLVIGVVGLIYFLKFCVLKFTGWITDFKESANNYIFIVFLVNKIIGIVVVPFIVVIAFSDKNIANIAVIISLLIISILFFLRFVRSYRLLKAQLKITRFHFFLYIIGIELLPLLVLYKTVLIFLNKNL